VADPNELLAYRIAENIIIHIDASSWTENIICDLISKLESPETLVVKKSFWRSMAAAAAILTPIGVYSAVRVMEIIKNKIPNFGELLGGSLWHPAVEKMMSAFFDPRQEFALEWIHFFESRLTDFIHTAIDRFALFVSAAGAEKAAYNADLGMEYLDIVITGILARTGESVLGRSLRSQDFFEMLMPLITTHEMRPCALTHCLSLLTTSLNSAKSVYASAQKAPDALSCFSGDSGKQFFMTLASMYDSEPLSVLEKVTSLLSVFAELRFQSIAEAMGHSGAIDAALHCAFRKHANSNILQMSTVRMFDEFMGRSGENIELVAAWIGSSEFLPFAVNVIQSQLHTTLSSRVGAYPYLVKIVGKIVALMIASDKIRVAISESQSLESLQPVFKEADEQYRKQSTWNATAETPRKRYFTESDDTEEEDEPFGRDPLNDVSNADFDIEHMDYGAITMGEVDDLF
jgi:hypothetical protein